MLQKCIIWQCRPIDCASFVCNHGTFCQLSVHPWDILSTSVNFPCVHSTFHQLLSTFCATAGSSVNNLYGCRTYRQHQSILHEHAGLTVNLRQLIVMPGDFPSGQLTFRQVSLCPRDLSTSFHFPVLLDSSSSSTEFPTLNS